jgi:hypothetical protein
MQPGFYTLYFKLSALVNETLTVRIYCFPYPFPFPLSLPITITFSISTVLVCFILYLPLLYRLFSIPTFMTLHI